MCGHQSVRMVAKLRGVTLNAAVSMLGVFMQLFRWRNCLGGDRSMSLFNSVVLLVFMSALLNKLPISLSTYPTRRKIFLIRPT